MTRDPDYGSLILCALALIAIAFVSLGLLSLVFQRQSPIRLAYAVAAFVLCFFAYDVISVGHLYSRSRVPGFPLLFWAVVTIAAVAIATYWGNRREFGVIFFSGVVAMAVVPAAKLAAFEAEVFGQGHSAARSQAGGAVLTSRPNIYFFLMDAYARADKILSYLVFR